jgi:hypothetical protein
VLGTGTTRAGFFPHFSVQVPVTTLLIICTYYVISDLLCPLIATLTTQRLPSASCIHHRFIIVHGSGHLRLSNLTKGLPGQAQGSTNPLVTGFSRSWHHLPCSMRPLRSHTVCRIDYSNRQKWLCLTGLGFQTSAAIVSSALR